MAIKAVWAVWHGCGHEEGHDLSAKRAFRRASYARWLAGRDCSGCRWARQNMRATEEHARNQAEFQPDEMMEITELALPNSKAVLSGLEGRGRLGLSGMAVPSWRQLWRRRPHLSSRARPSGRSAGVEAKSGKRVAPSTQGSG